MWSWHPRDCGMMVAEVPPAPRETVCEGSDQPPVHAGCLPPHAHGCAFHHAVLSLVPCCSARRLASRLGLRGLTGARGLLEGFTVSGLRGLAWAFAWALRADRSCQARALAGSDLSVDRFMVCNSVTGLAPVRAAGDAAYSTLDGGLLQVDAQSVPGERGPAGQRIAPRSIGLGRYQFADGAVDQLGDLPAAVPARLGHALGA